MFVLSPVMPLKSRAEVEEQADALVGGADRATQPEPTDRRSA
ncbi:hypothetical protein [Streptomyces sp. NPDC008122]